MKLLIRYLTTYILLSILLIDHASSNPIKKLIDLITNQLKKREKTKNNQFDDSVIYAIPSHDGQGFILHGYGKPNDPYAYDNDVDIYQTSKMWSGQVKIPNFLPKENLFNERVIKGSDNRLGFRVAIPFLGDFQYLREIGPGRFTDNLGPGQFTYPGFNDKPKKIPQVYDHELDSYGHGHPGDSYAGDTNELGHHHDDGDDTYSSGSDQKPVYASNETKPDPLEGMRNYPWFRK